MGESALESTFELEDASGASVSYSVNFHPAGEGFRLSAELVKLLGGAFAAVVDGEGDDVDMGAVMGALKDLDVDDFIDLSTKVLKYTHRNGKSMKGHAFDVAYRGNYLELYQALFEVIKVNKFLPLPGGFGEAANE